MKKHLYKLTAVLCTLFLVASCSEDDDATGYSTENPTSPTLDVATDFQDSETLIESDTTYAFTVSISEPQIVDVQVDLAQVGGDATEGEDFSFPHSITIPAGQTSVTGEIAIHADDLIEEPESVQIQIGLGAESNVSAINSKTVTFNIQNLEGDELMASLSWESSATVTDNSGEVIEPTDLADLRLLVTDVPYTEIVDQADGAGFESITLDADTPDGEYYLIADFFAAMDIARDLDLTLSFDQPGIINGETYSFPAALNTSVSCASEYFILAKVTKTGDNYTIELVEEKSKINLNNFVGAWAGTTSYGHESQVVTSLNAEGKIEITGIGVGFMTVDWGEAITNMETLVVEDIDLETGDFTIPETYYMTTTYEGVVQDDYYLSATGNFDKCSGTLTIDYDFIQDGTSYTEWLTVGFGYPPFEENDLTLE